MRARNLTLHIWIAVTLALVMGGSLFGIWLFIGYMPWVQNLIHKLSIAQ